MLKAISNKIQLGNTFNLLDDQTGVPSINDEGTLENFIGKVDKVWDFLKTGKADGELSRYFLKILPITRQSQTDGELPMKAFAYKYAFAYVYALRIQIKNSWNLYQILLQVLAVIIVPWKYVSH